MRFEVAFRELFGDSFVRCLLLASWGGSVCFVLLSYRYRFTFAYCLRGYRLCDIVCVLLLLGFGLGLFFWFRLVRLLNRSFV